MRFIEKPKPEEYPFYSHIYIDLLSDDGMVLKHLRQNFTKVKELVYSLPKEKLYYRYGVGKWTIKEILVHIIDDERIFSYRALRYARDDDTPLHGFEQNDYAVSSEANRRNLDSIFEEYESVRNATITLFQNFPKDALMRSGSGIGPDHKIVNKRTVRAIAYHIAGHELRHLNIIRERYL